VGLAWSNDSESYASGTKATDRASHTRQVKDGDPNKKGYPGPTGWGLSMGIRTLPHKKMYSVEKVLRRG